MRKMCKVSLLFLLTITITTGCTHVFSEQSRPQTGSFDFKEVLQNPTLYKGKKVVWGGEIIEIVNKKDQTTIIEIYQKPLDSFGEPEDSKLSSGRFIVTVNKFLDPYLFERGKSISVEGEIIGEQMKLIGEMNYRYPLLLGKIIHLWHDSSRRTPHEFYPLVYGY